MSLLMRQLSWAHKVLLVAGDFCFLPDILLANPESVDTQDKYMQNCMDMHSMKNVYDGSQVRDDYCVQRLGKGGPPSLQGFSFVVRLLHCRDQLVRPNLSGP